MIEFDAVTLKYHYEQYPLFEQLSFSLNGRENTVLCDIQSGKSSLCKMIMGLLPPNEGKVSIDGKSVYDGNLKSAKCAPPFDILYLPEMPAFFENRSVDFNLRYPLKVRKISDEAVVQKLACDFDLESLLKTKVKELTKRQKKLLALARGASVCRDIVLFDGFFDDTCLDDNLLNPQSVKNIFNSKMQVFFTAKPELAFGNTVVLDGGKCVFCGDKEGAAECVKKLEWLAYKLEC